MKTVLITTILVLSSATLVSANVVLPDVIGDAMVLQCNRPVPIWGQADAGDVVTVKFAGQVKKTTAGADGRWLVKLDSLHANAAPATMTISGKNTIELFAIAGVDHQWHWAEARIVRKNRIEVWSDTVPQPLAVRYAFNNNPKHPNLTNETGLPATPFRTDDWPGPTDGKR